MARLGDNNRDRALARRGGERVKTAPPHGRSENIVHPLDCVRLKRTITWPGAPHRSVLLSGASIQRGAAASQTDALESAMERKGARPHGGSMTYQTRVGKVGFGSTSH